MFDNIGGKIKGLAKFYCWAGIVVSALAGLSMLEYEPAVGIIVAGIGALLSWVSSFLLYGFGELIDNTESINYMMYQQGNKGNPEIASKWYCTRCGQENTGNAAQCKNCGQYRT